MEIKDKADIERIMAAKDGEVVAVEGRETSVRIMRFGVGTEYEKTVRFIKSQEKQNGD